MKHVISLILAGTLLLFLAAAGLARAEECQASSRLIE
jgi:hypothetical protein